MFTAIVSPKNAVLRLCVYRVRNFASTESYRLSNRDQVHKPLPLAIGMCLEHAWSRASVCHRTATAQNDTRQAAEGFERAQMGPR